MFQIGLIAWMAFTQPPASGTAQNPKAQAVQMLATFAIFAVIFYLLMIRPQQTKAKEHARLLKELKPGDRVLTSGGIVGVIITVKEKSLSIRSADAKLEIVKSAVTEITDKSSSSTES